MSDAVYSWMDQVSILRRENARLLAALAAAEARQAALVDWRDRVVDYLCDMGTFEENAQLQPGRQSCPFCGTKDRDEEDGAWQHHEWCPLCLSHSLYMAAPLHPVTCRVVAASPAPGVVAGDEEGV